MRNHVLAMSTGEQGGEHARRPAMCLEFGRYRLLPARRELLVDGRPVKLGCRAFDLLVALIEARGTVVSKDALITRVWSHKVVEENNLHSQISALRSVFTDERGLIRTVSGRGYQFTASVSCYPLEPDNQRSIAEFTPTPARASATRSTKLPKCISELIGRDDELCDIALLISERRLTTLTGPGGIGKTRLAIAVAWQLLSDFPAGVWIVELAPVDDPDAVPAALASAIGLELSAGDPMENLVSAFGGQRGLFVLDNCEHVIDSTASVTGALLRANPALHLVATSREPLSIEGEWVYAVPPLDFPSETPADDDDLLRYHAVRLFLERARAADCNFAPDQGQLGTIASICRRLDGIPLAIELAAARVATLGLAQLAARLNAQLEKAVDLAPNVPSNVAETSALR